MSTVVWERMWWAAGLAARLEACRAYMSATGGTLGTFMKLGFYVRCSWLARQP